MNRSAAYQLLHDTARDRRPVKMLALTGLVRRASSLGVSRAEILAELEAGALHRERGGDTVGAEAIRSLCDRITGFAHPLSRLTLPH
jgi:hypothetical protein